MLTPRLMRKGLTAMVGALLLSGSAFARSDEPVTYVCVKEREVGWREPRENAKDAIGRFQA